MPPPLRLTNLDEARLALEKLQAKGEPHERQGWPAARALRHCAQSIELSLSGYPAMKPAVLRHTVGRLVAWLFLRRGYMDHDITAAIPGAPEPRHDDATGALDELLEAIERYQRFDGEPQPHFVFGRLSKGEFERLHAMHIADHLAVIEAEK